MKLLGFSLNDAHSLWSGACDSHSGRRAIVVVEDCARLVQEGKLTPRQSAEKAMQELQGPVIGEVLVLLSVFYPHGFYQRHHRRALQAVCIDYRHLGSLLGIQCSDVYAGHVRAVS